MTAFFWITVVGSFLALLYIISKGEMDWTAVAKFLVALGILVIALITRCSTGEDPFEPKEPEFTPVDSFHFNDPTVPDGYDSHQDFWQDVLNEQN